MHPHESLVRELLGALGRRDGEAMAACYHPDIFFSDPIFPSLRGDAAIELWRVLASRARDLTVTMISVEADDDGARAVWEARYTFGPRRRTVVNRVDSLFAFRDGRVVRQFDRFPFWRWASQALGPAGKLLGWFGPFKWWVRRQSRRRLSG